LRNLKITHQNQVWATDITYIPMKKGFMYLCAVIDLHSRFVLSWGLSNTMETAFCIEVLNEALEHHGQPEIFNTDQGSQFTAEGFSLCVVNDLEVWLSMDSKGRAIDNILNERLWHSVKYEHVYLFPASDGLGMLLGTEDVCQLLY